MVARLRPLALVVLVLVCASCATSRPLTFVPQRTEIDCAIAALAMAAHTSYERVDSARTDLDIHPEVVGGTPISDILLIAGRLNLRLVPLSPGMVHIEHDNGIAIVALGEGWTHAVYVEHGQVFDPLRDGPEPWQAWYGATATYRLYTFLRK